jgi:hypothetical protein
MSPATDETVTEFERNARTVLAQSLSRLDARTRSRLTQARHAALAVAERRDRLPWWRRSTLMPAAGALAAAVLVAFVLWQRPPAGELPAQLPLLEGQHLAVEDMDLLADSDALDLIEGWDGPFYEWAASQTDANGASDG